MLAALIVVFTFFGLTIGSFLNVVTYRVPRHESVVSPGSRCPTCGTPILARDNVPLLSWMVLRGRCRHCHSKISIRYPLIELLCAALCAGLAARLGFNWDLPAMTALVVGLVALSVIDIEHLTLPKVVVYPTLVSVSGFLVLAAGETSDWHRLLIAALCGLAWFVTFLLINLLSPRYLGFGDVRLAPVLGLGLGWLGPRYVILGFFAANLIGAGVGIVLISFKKIKRDQQIPYGVFLALGVTLAIFAGPELLAPFQKFS